MINIWLLVLAIAGIVLTLYIRHIKVTHKKTVCVIGGGCNTVIHSRYSKVFGFPLEVLGLIYYSFVAILVIMYFYGITMISVFSLSSTLLVMGAIAVLFAIYLTYVQGIILKEWCQYCLSSAVISILIFVVELVH